MADSERLVVCGERSAIHGEPKCQLRVCVKSKRLLLDTPLVTAPFKPRLIHTRIHTKKHTPKITAHPSRHVNNIHLPNENNRA